MDKATPDSAPASVDSFMSLLRNHENRISETYGVLQDRRIPSEEVRAAIDASWEARNALIAEVERLAAQSAPLQQAECTCAAKDMPFGRCCRAAAQVEPSAPPAPGGDVLAALPPLTCPNYLRSNCALYDPQAARERVSKKIAADPDWLAAEDAAGGVLAAGALVALQSTQAPTAAAQGQDAAPAEQAQTGAARDVLAERQRQIEKEGWTPGHDDHHRDNSLAKAASCYAWAACGLGPDYPPLPPVLWPWASAWWKPKDQRTNLVRAGALILAEIERIDRAARAKE